MSFNNRLMHIKLRKISMDDLYIEIFNKMLSNVHKKGRLLMHIAKMICI